MRNHQSDFSRVEKNVLVGSVILTGVLSYLFFSDSWVRLFDSEEPSQSIKVGYLESTANDVRRKSKGQLSWQTGARRDTLYYEDSIYAGKASKAKIVLNQGSDLLLNENSLVILRNREEASFLDLQYGSVQGKMKKHSVLHFGKNSKLKSGSDADFHLKSTDSGLEIQVLSGSVDIETDKGKKRLEKNSKLKVLDNGDLSSEKKIGVQLLLPKYGEKSFEKGETLFEWSELPGKEEYKVSISSEPDFQNPVVSSVVTGKSFTTTLPTGAYYWKVTPLGDDEKSSETWWFENIALSPPKPIYPPEDSRFSFLSKNGENFEKSMTFVFQQIPSINRYEIEISTDEDFQDSEILLETETDRVEDVRLSPDVYHWRVRSVFSGSRSSWSKASHFTIRHKKLESPTWRISKLEYEIPKKDYSEKLFNSPENEIDAFLLSDLGDIPSLTPESVYSESIPSKMQVSRRPSFENASEYSFSNSDFKLRSVVPGKYFARSRFSGFDSNSDSGWSDPLKYTVRTYPPDVPGFDEKMGTKNEKPKVPYTLRWGKTLFAKKYEIKISRHEDFAISKTFVSKRNRFHINVFPEKNYFWKVRALDKNKKPISRFSDISQFIYRTPIERKLANVNEEEKKEERTKIDYEEELEKYYPDYWMWAGAGFNLVRFGQDSDVDSAALFQSFNGPSLYLEAGASFDKHAATVTYKNTPGIIDNSSNGQEPFGYDWQTISLEGHYLFGSPFLDGGRTSRWTARYGFHYHTIPLLDVSDDGQDLSSSSRDFITLGLGGGYSYIFSEKLAFEIFMKYQYPFSSGGSNEFSVSSDISFDGSLGVMYRLSKWTRFGAFWYGQWHIFGFTTTQNDSETNGSLDIFYSNFDLRMSFDF